MDEQLAWTEREDGSFTASSRVTDDNSGRRRYDVRPIVFGMFWSIGRTDRKLIAGRDRLVWFWHPDGAREYCEEREASLIAGC